MSLLRLSFIAIAVALAGCTATVGGTGTPDAGAAACPGATSRADGVDLATALPVRTGQGLTSVTAGRSGPLTLDGAVAGQPDTVAAARRRDLAAAGFVAGYQRTWEAGSPGSRDYRAQVLIVYHFATPDGACRFAEAERARFTFAPLQVPGVPGAVGIGSGTGSTRQATAEGTKGTYVIEANGLSYAEPVESWSVGLLQQAYASL